jgi:hypothetical protein
VYELVDVVTVSMNPASARRGHLRGPRQISGQSGRAHACLVLEAVPLPVAAWLSRSVLEALRARRSRAVDSQWRSTVRGETCERLEQRARATPRSCAGSGSPSAARSSP